MAQILLTGEDVEIPERREHLQSTFSALLELGVIPVVNENEFRFLRRDRNRAAEGAGR